MIDIDKLVCSIVENGFFAKVDFEKALKQQGLECKDGSLHYIGEEKKPDTIKFNEPDIEGMVNEYSDSLSIVPSITKDEKLYYYRQGLEDMYKRLKGE